MATEVFVKKVSATIRPHQNHLAQATTTILDQEVSKYPIFVLSREEISLGVKLIGALEEDPAWSIHVTTLEEMASKQVVRMDRVDDFRSIYKDPNEFFCLFIVDDADSQFVFVPREMSIK